MDRGFDMVELTPSEHRSANGIEAAKLVRFREYNPQSHLAGAKDAPRVRAMSGAIRVLARASSQGRGFRERRGACYRCLPFLPGGPVQLGAFSVSLAVKDIAASRAFYEALGFTVFGGNQEQHWLIMKNGTTLIGLFQGMFEKNSLTFNPGWDSDAQLVPGFTDVRELQRVLKEKGIAFTIEAKDGSGPGHFVVVDPDGNPVLVDQHV